MWTCEILLKFIGVDLLAAWSCVVIPEALGMCCDSRGTRPCASEVEQNCERFDAASERVETLTLVVCLSSRSD